MNFVWHLGDISYADDDFLEHPLQFGYERIWNDYMNSVQPFAAYAPYMVLPGNHEAECHSPLCIVSIDKSRQLRNFSAYNGRFQMPSDVSNGVLNMWYSFNLGPIHFVNFNTETDFSGAPSDTFLPGEDNGGFGDPVAWLRADLEAAVSNRSIRPWIIVGGHRPIYSITAEKDNKPIGNYRDLQTAIEGILHESQVDLYISGHVHGYERQQPLFNNTVTENCSDSCTDPSSTIHIIDGSAGSIEGLQKPPNNPASWTVVNNFDSFGYAILEISSSNTGHVLKWSFFSSDSGEMLDSLTITKSTQ